MRRRLRGRRSRAGTHSAIAGWSGSTTLGRYSPSGRSTRPPRSGFGSSTAPYSALRASFMPELLGWEDAELPLLDPGGSLHGALATAVDPGLRRGRAPHARRNSDHPTPRRPVPDSPTILPGAGGTSRTIQSRSSGSACAPPPGSTKHYRHFWRVRSEPPRRRRAAPRRRCAATTSASVTVRPSSSTGTGPASATQRWTSPSGYRASHSREGPEPDEIAAPIRAQPRSHRSSPATSPPPPACRRLRVPPPSGPSSSPSSRWRCPGRSACSSCRSSSQQLGGDAAAEEAAAPRERERAARHPRRDRGGRAWRPHRGRARCRGRRAAAAGRA